MIKTLYNYVLKFLLWLEQPDLLAPTVGVINSCVAFWSEIYILVTDVHLMLGLQSLQCLYYMC